MSHRSNLDSTNSPKFQEFIDRLLICIRITSSSLDYEIHFLGVVVVGSLLDFYWPLLGGDEFFFMVSNSDGILLLSHGGTCLFWKCSGTAYDGYISA